MGVNSSINSVILILSITATSLIFKDSRFFCGLIRFLNFEFVLNRLKILCINRSFECFSDTVILKAFIYKAFAVILVSSVKDYGMF